MRFPPEVIMLIAGFCRTADLAVMARSGPDMCSIAEGELYRTVADSKFERSQLIGCLYVISTRPHIAAMVRSIDIQRSHHRQPFGQAYLRLLARVLPLVERITTLQLPADLPLEPFLVAHCLGATSPNRTLQRLVGPWWLATKGIYDPDEWYGFLSLQTNLVSLTMFDVRLPETLEGFAVSDPSRLCLPKLRRLMVTAYFLPYMLKTSLEELQYLEIDARVNIRNIDPMVSPKHMELLAIRIKLCVENSGENFAHLGHYLRHFPSIISLQIQVPNGFESQTHAQVSHFPSYLAYSYCSC